MAASPNRWHPPSTRALTCSWLDHRWAPQPRPRGGCCICVGFRTCGARWRGRSCSGGGVAELSGARARAPLAAPSRGRVAPHPRRQTPGHKRRSGARRGARWQRRPRRWRPTRTTLPRTASIASAWIPWGLSVDPGSERPTLLAQWPHGHHTTSTSSPRAPTGATSHLADADATEAEGRAGPAHTDDSAYFRRRAAERADLAAGQAAGDGHLELAAPYGALDVS